MSDDVNDFLFQGGARSFPFKNYGDTCRGTIVEMEKRQQTDIDGNLLFWPDGKKREQIVFTLQTTERESEDDDGLRTIYAKGGRYEVAQGEGQSMRDAIADAVKDAKASRIEIGDELAVGYTGTGKAKKGYTAPKLYAASFRKGSSSIKASDLFADEPTALETGV
jgi:hypothetical protein